MITTKDSTKQLTHASNLNVAITYIATVLRSFTSLLEVLHMHHQSMLDMIHMHRQSILDKIYMHTHASPITFVATRIML